MMSNHEAVLFDMDGVTVETAVVWRELERTEILPAAVAGDPPVEEVRALSVGDAYERLRDLETVDVTVSVAEFEALYDDRAREVYRGRATLLPGYRELLTTLQTAGYATGLVSASRREWVSMVLDRFDLAELYDAVVSASDVEGPSKPDPRTYLVAAEQVGVDPADCIAVEDSPHGLEAAVGAGMDCLALRGAGNADDDLSAADRVVASAAELRAVLSEWDVIDDQ